MYLMLSVAGHLTIFLTRTRGPFWSIRPAKILWMAVLGTQIIATFIAVYGFLMPPLGWGWAGFVWAYALVWFLVSDRVKLLAYRFLDPLKVVVMPESKTDVKPKLEADGVPDLEAKAEQNPDAETTETKPALKSTPEIAARTTSDLTPQIAARAYELYEQQGHHDGQSAQNWNKAEQEIRATQAQTKANAESKPAAKAESGLEAKDQKLLAAK
jgi:H+-transporting ATPase